MKHFKHFQVLTIRFRSLLLITLLLSAGIGYGITARAQYPGDTIRLLDAVLQKDIKQGLAPGGVFTVTRNGVVIYNKAYGYADLEHEVKITPSTVFEAGSVSKQFTATALLLLVRDGKIGVDDDIRKYIPEMPDYGTPIRVRNLFTHTSGIKDWGSVLELAGWPRTTKVYTQDIARQVIFRQKTLNFEPGTEYSYSNSNFTLIATLVERISKQSLAAFTEERIFQPLGMTHTQWRDDYRKVVTDRAIAYIKADSGYLMDMPFEHTHGHGGLLTTTADMLTWNQYWNTGRFGEVLTKLRLTHGVLKDGTVIPYSLGAVFQAPFLGENEISHSGATAGYRAWLATYPASGICVAYLSNCANTSPVSAGKRAIEVFLGKDPGAITESRVTLTPAELTAKAGVYKSVKGHDIIELTAGGKNELALSTGAVLKAITKDSFAVGSQKLVFSGADGLTVQTNAGNREYKKVRLYQPSAGELAAFAGLYYSEEADATLDVKVEGNRLIAYRTPTVKLRFNPSYKDAFTVGRSVLVEYIRDKKGKPVAFSMSISRAENIIFTKK